MSGDVHTVLHITAHEQIVVCLWCNFSLPLINQKNQSINQFLLKHEPLVNVL